MTYMKLNIGTEDCPDLICIKSIKRMRNIKGTDQWEIWGCINPMPGQLPITISGEKYMEMMTMIDEYELNKMDKMMRRKEHYDREQTAPTIRIVTD